MLQNLAQIESEFARLSLDDQIHLVERLVRTIRQRAAQPLASDADLARMASDPDIQRKLAAANDAFADAELDGLDETL